MNYLNNINNPKDLKKLNVEELPILCTEIREFLIDSVSKTGGHLASNLGVVELSVALHYVLDSPTDKIIFDVGHQAYVHKILTGRKDEFDTLRKYNGLSGFPKYNESSHDAFEVGHSSTSISAACGYAVSRDLQGLDYSIVSVIGDGSITGGMAYEALLDIGKMQKNVIVILNDNEMSISKSDSAMAKYLNKISINKKYIKVKKNTKKFVSKIPLIGEPIAKFIEEYKNAFKNLFIKDTIFDELGFKYVGIIDGHDVSTLVNILNKVTKLNGPILLHVKTKKGKGYNLAEDNQTSYHGVSTFNKDEGISVKNDRTYSDVFSDILIKNAKVNKNIVAITPAMVEGSGLSKFRELYSDRCLDVGICEQHAITEAAAMAKSGLKPIVSIYSTFLQRGYDQIVHDVCLQNANVIFMIDRAGIVGADGPTHHGVFDISFLSHIPNLKILAPINENEMDVMFSYALKQEGPIAIRYPRGNLPAIAIKNKQLKEYESVYINTGEQIAIIAVGNMFEVAYNVVSKLIKYNINVTLINPRFIKPMDKKMVDDMKNYDNVIVMEDNVEIGGFSNMLLSEFNKNNIKTKVHSMSYKDQFIEHGDVKQLYKKHHLDEEHLIKLIRNLIFEKK